MKLDLEIFSALCATSKFKINEIDADSSDFGEQYDRDTEGAEPYCCGDMQFTRKEPTEDVLKKYKITEIEYYDICSKLESKLSFGSCGWCS